MCAASRARPGSGSPLTVPRGPVRRSPAADDSRCVAGSSCFSLRLSGASAGPGGHRVGLRLRLRFRFRPRFRFRLRPRLGPHGVWDGRVLRSRGSLDFLHFPVSPRTRPLRAVRLPPRPPPSRVLRGSGRRPLSRLRVQSLSFGARGRRLRTPCSRLPPRRRVRSRRTGLLGGPPRPRREAWGAGHSRKAGGAAPRRQREAPWSRLLRLVARVCASSLAVASRTASGTAARASFRGR